MKRERALVVFSGGQDSTTCLYWALRNFSDVEALTFDYGQRHRIELDAAAWICRFAGVEQVVLKLPDLSRLTKSALLHPETDLAQSDLSTGLPAAFVPGRNLLFMTYAAAIAYERQIRSLVTGVCQTDYSGYPDCRRETMDALTEALNLGMEAQFKIFTPLMDLTKAQSVRLAVEVGAMEALAFSHTCYNGQFPPCGSCPACLLRAKGFAEADVEDPLVRRGRSNES